MLSFFALGEYALGEVPESAQGFVATGAVTLDIVGAATGVHGIQGTGIAALDLSAAAEGEYQNISVSGTGDAALAITAAATGAHGAAGSGAFTLDLASDGAAAHGVSSSAEAGITFTADATGAHGVSGTASITLGVVAAAVGVHERYEVRGEVRLAGVLVNRQVRAYRRDTGAMVGEAATVAGRFQLHTGFTAAEHYVVPIDLAEGATDWMPPVANRVLSVLAMDA